MKKIDWTSIKPKQQRYEAEPENRDALELDSIIIEDTRNHVDIWADTRRDLEDIGVGTYRSKLAVGDYAPPPPIAIDTKRGFAELCQNFCSSDHGRVRSEILRAQAMGTQLIFLVIDDAATSIDDAKNWHNPFGFISGERLFKTLDTVSKRYGVRFIFCKPSQAATTIKGLLAPYLHPYDSTKAE